MAITFTGSRLRLTSEGDEIGEWDLPMYQLTRADESEFIFTAEGQDLTFRPLHPDDFAAAAVNGTEVRHGADEIAEVPPAKPITLLLFYLLVVGTSAMGVWALLTLVG